MRIGQRSILVFGTKVFGSILGFIATIYFARLLGADTIGTYALTLSVLAWCQLAARLGITKAMIKRISEGESQGEYLSAGILMVIVTVLIMCAIILLMEPWLNEYIQFHEYSDIPISLFLIILLTIHIILSIILATLSGENLVHVSEFLRSGRLLSQSVVQIILVALSLGLVGMLIGYGVGGIIMVVLGLKLVSLKPRLPEIGHIKSIFQYSKYAWMSGLKSRALNDVDIVVLGAFVPQALVGIYAISWSLSKFLDLFGVAVSKTVFPEMSHVAKNESKTSAVSLFEDSIAFCGLIVIPGLIGGVVLSDRLLRIYGNEFEQGASVLALLLLSILFYSYYQQYLNALNAMDYPELAFQSNLVFILTNIVLNVILVWHLGWIGAAIASVASTVIGLSVSHLLLGQIIQIVIPYEELGKQWSTGVFMGISVLFARRLLEGYTPITNNAVLVIILVSFGVIVYTSSLLLISNRFKETVIKNLPFRSIRF